MTIEGGEADAEMGRVGLAEFGDVVGDGAFVIGCEFRVAFVEKPQQRRFQTGPA